MQHFAPSTLAGSIFHEYVFADPEQLLHYLNSRSPDKKIDDEEAHEVWLYEVKEHDSVGTLGIAAIDEVAAESIISVHRGRHTQRAAVVASLPTTRWICAIVKTTNEGPQLITAFPGTRAAPFPHKKQSPTARHRSEEFWRGHVLLVAGGESKTTAH